MENWITRIVASFCAMGSMGLFWTFGVFVVVPWREGRMFALDKSELQMITVPLLIGMAVAWGAVHIYGIADRQKYPTVYKAICLIFFVACITAMVSGISWTQAKLG